MGESQEDLKFFFKSCLVELSITPFTLSPEYERTSIPTSANPFAAHSGKLFSSP